ncbi:M48 family metalloprotease [Humitalea sp. 24SJ18S-53]|uniref:M48 family metalloprotease n=1 Tax=Humitalea sp. 24SJ18S-53 TaxID=3422307 RepID=UPI003D667DD1
MRRTALAGSVLNMRSGWARAAIAAAAMLLAGCDDPLTPPVPDRAAIDAARREIAQSQAPRPIGRGLPAERAMLQRVAGRLTQAAQPFCQAELRRGCAFVVDLADQPQANAFATGRNQVVVTTGMMRLLENEDELAAVVAHEFAHHIAEHISEGSWRTQVGALAGAAAGAIATEALGIDIGLERIGAQAGAQAGRLSFSKADEREADYLGAYIMARAGFDLARAGTIWAKLSHLSGRGTTSLLDSHPAGPERLATWRQTVEEVRASRDGVPRRDR